MSVEQVLERIKQEEVVEESVVRSVCKKVQEILMGEANLEIISSPIVLVGDVHGQFYDVLKMLSIGTPCISQLVSHPKPGISS